MENIIAFLPCRKGSQRVLNKNTRQFAEIKGGLTKIKLTQLINCKKIDKVIVSTDDEYVKEIAGDILSASDKNYEILDRPKGLATSETSTDDLIAYVKEIIPTGHVLWTHVTSPFITPDIYDDVILNYKKGITDKIYDSLITVSKHQGFFWNEERKPLTYNSSEEKWPRTQTVQPIFEINNGIFLASSKIYKQYNDRIGIKPQMYELDHYASLDIDWEEDFYFAEDIWKSKFK